MKRKKIVGVLVCLGVVAVSAGFISTKCNFSEAIKENVVYAATTNSSETTHSFKMSDEEQKKYEAKTSEIIKKYFNASPKKEDGYEFRTSRWNEETINNLIEEHDSECKKYYDDGTWTKEEYDANMKYYNEKAKAKYEIMKEDIQGMKHGSINAMYVKSITNENTKVEPTYQVEFNEDTKEIDDVYMADFHDKSEISLNLSDEKVQEVAVEFMNNNDLCTIENPNLILINPVKQEMDDGSILYERTAFFEDKNDSSKKFEVRVDNYTGKVVGFATSDAANYNYNSYINK